MNNIKFSIITISYNQAKFISQTIESVINQSYKNIEYIVVDAGSVDGSRDIILEYKDSIKEIIFESDKGPANGLNKGIGKASGEIYGFLNSDDILLKDALLKVINCFSESTADAVLGNGYVIDDKGFLVKKVIANSVNLTGLKYNNASFIQPSIFIKADAFGKVGKFNEENSTCWDYELLIELLKNKCKLEKTNYYLSAFRLHNSSITCSGKAKIKFENDLNRIYRNLTNKNIGMIYYITKYFYKIIKLFSHPNIYFVGNKFKNKKLKINDFI